MEGLVEAESDFQLIERCRDPRLRRKFLEKTNATLKDLQDLARVQEAVNSQDQSSGQVNAVSGKPHSKGEGKGTAQGRNKGNKPGKSSGGSQETKVRGPSCPARSKKCNACGEIGHFAVCCKTKERKPLRRDDEGRNNTRGRVYQLSEDSATGQQDYYAFTVGVGQPTSGSEVDLKVGGVTLPAVLIDSGASCNVIDQATWEVLKKKSVQCEY